MVLFQHGALDVILSPAGSYLLFGEFQWTRDSSLAASSAWRSNAEKWRCLDWNRMILSFSGAIQQNLVIKCIFYCLTIV